MIVSWAARWAPGNATSLTALVVACVLLAGPAVASEVVPLGPAAERYDLAAALFILEDEGGAWTIDDVASPARSAGFAPVERMPLDLGETASAYWLRFTVTDPGPAIPTADVDWVLRVETRYLDSLRVYSPLPPAGRLDAPAEGRGWRMRAGGFLETGESIDPVIVALDVPAGGTTTLYARLQSRAYVFVRSLEIQTASVARTRAERWALYLGLFFGGMLLVILLNLFLFFSLRDRNYLYCVFYQVAVVAYLLWRNGLLDPLLPDSIAPLFGYLHVVGIGLIVLTSAGFTRAFLRTRENAPGMDKLILGQMALAAGMLALTPFVGWELLSWCTIGLGLITPFTTIGPGIQCLRRGFQPARLYLWAWSVFALSAFLFAAPIDLGFDGADIFQVGCGVNALLLTLALADRVRSLRRKRESAEEALGESEDRYRAIFQTAGTSMVIFGDDAVILLANDAFATLTGYSRDEIEGRKTWKDFFLGGCLEKMEISSDPGGGDAVATPRSCEARLQERGGGVHEGVVSVAIVPGTDQRVASFQDLTERRRIEQQMVQADKMAALGQIIAGVAHEINNPNNFIYFNLPILKRYIEAMRPLLETHREADPDLRLMNMPYDVFLEDLLKLLENMEHGSQRITGIVADLKNYVRSDESQAMKPSGFAPVIERLMALTGKQVRKMVRRFEVDVADGLPPVKMNPGKIEQVLINLVINAGQAADKDDSWIELKVRTAPDDDRRLEITVEDNGAGIPEEIRGRIFEPFFTSKGREEGTGLGLSISHRIIEQHGGTIDVRSAVGEGTRFTIRLPVSDEAAEPLLP